MEVCIMVKFYYQSRLDFWKLAGIIVLMAMPLLIGCSQKTNAPETSQTMSLTGTIVEIDDHGNAVTDLYIAPFTEHGWELGDTLEATFATGQKNSDQIC